MTLKFDKDGFAIDGGDIRVFYFDAVTKEYVGWSDEYIYEGVSMPGSSTAINPGEEVNGKVAVFDGKKWNQEEDHRGETVYSIDDSSAATVNYIGPIKEGFTTAAPESPYDKWNGKKWVKDTAAQHAADVAEAEQQKQQLIDVAMQSISLIQLKLQAGRTLNDTDKAKLNAVLDYIDAITAADTSTAPDISWACAGGVGHSRFGATEVSTTSNASR
ncbi:tail fiber assembly protein [Dryocola sp. BD586]|uniref:tail fiber assembly protein n=1 Tax=Dryocola sp. BD586 TaxID=3133271 RepID=UPI003F4FD533